MATTQGQDVIRCQLCSYPVEHHCTLCQVDLCHSCIPKHMANKSRKHDVVEYTSRREHTFTLFTCPIHKKIRCEKYCLDCKIPICFQCLMGSHKKHKFTNINNILQERKQQLISDTEELENTIVQKYRNINLSAHTIEFDKVLSAIKEQEEKICKVVCETSIQLAYEIARHKREGVRKSRESESFKEKAEIEVNQIVQRNKDIIRGNDARAILNYQSRNGNFRRGPVLPRISCPQLLPGTIIKDQISEMFGFLQTGYDLKRPRMLKLMDDPVVQSTIQSSYGFGHELWRVQCVGRDKILTSGDDRTIKQIDRTGSILKTIHTKGDVLALTINLQQKPVFSVFSFQEKPKVYTYDKGKVKTLLSINGWIPLGLFYTGNGNLLVSMCSLNKKQSRIVRYSGTKEVQKIQYDRLGQPLFSTGVTKLLLLTENGNGDICVADQAMDAVVVVDSSGRLRFKYLGNLSNQTKYKSLNHLESLLMSLPKY